LQVGATETLSAVNMPSVPYQGTEVGVVQATLHCVKIATMGIAMMWVVSGNSASFPIERNSPKRWSVCRSE
jgi:hypothetical protein